MAFFRYGQKNIYYEEIGEGLPVVLLHGDTASSKMFEPIIPLYADSFKVILMDFLGNGNLIPKPFLKKLVQCIFFILFLVK